MSLRTRLMLLVLLATLLPALWVGWRFVRDSDAEITIAEKALAESADNLAEDLEHRVQGTAQLHYGLALSGLLDGNDKEACSTYLADVREAYPQYTGIVTALPDGRLFCDSLRSGREVNLSDRPYFKRVLDGAGLTLDPVFGRITGNAVLQVVYPARTAEGRLRFMLVASLNLKKFAREARWQGPAGSPQLVILDRKGVVMAWDGEGSDLGPPGTPLAGTPLFALAQSRPEGGLGELTDADGRTMVWAITGHQTARDAGLHLMLGRPKSELVAAAQLRLRQDLSFLLVAAGLAFAAVWLFGEFGIREPVGRIVNMVRALGSGNLGARIAMPYPRGELGSLMAALNSTAASLERQRTAIESLASSCARRRSSKPSARWPVASRTTSTTCSARSSATWRSPPRKPPKASRRSTAWSRSAALRCARATWCSASRRSAGAMRPIWPARPCSRSSRRCWRWCRSRRRPA